MDLEHPEHLLDNGQLIRSLATALVHGAADVDDVVQGTYAAALGSPRKAGFPLPRWLLGITRNVARRWRRDQRRRSARELAAAKPEALRSAAEVLELEELRRLVVSAVLELPEPQRSAVLLRYYDGLPPRAIAVQLDLSAAAVRSHLHRGLATLRQRLDRAVRGGRAAWVALLLPLAPVPAPHAAAATALKVAVPIAIAAAVALFVATTQEPTLAEQLGSAPPTADGPGPEQAAVVADAGPRVRVSESPGASAEPAVAPLATLRFLDHAGQPLAGPELRERFAATRTEPTVLLLDVATLERGGLEGMVATRLGDPAAWQHPRALQFVAGGAEVHDAPGAGRFQLLIARPSAPAHLTPPFALPASAALAFDVPLPAPDRARTVRAVASEGGIPLAGARLRAYTEFGDDRAFVAGSTVVADASGAATIHDAVPDNPLLIRPAIWWVETDDCAVRIEATATEIAVPRRGACAGTAQRDDGSAAVGWTVAFARDKGPRAAARVDAEGRYRLDGAAAGTGLLALLGDSAPGMRSLGIRVTAGATQRYDFAVDGAHATLVGRVTAGAVPLPGVTVMAAKGRSGRSFATTGVDGAYRLEQVVTNARFAILLGDPDVSDDFVIQRSEPLSLQPGAETVLDFDLPRGCVPVRVVDDATGAPLAGVAVDARPAGEGVQQDRFPGYRFRAGWAARTDQNGEALLRGLPEGEPHVVKAGGGGLTTATAALSAPALDAQVERLVLRVRRK